jgi:outer membrane lipoprotein SlyB
MSRVTRLVRFGVPFLLLAALAGCKPDYSANTYSSTAVQQANKVDQAVVIGRRSVGVTPTGVTGGTTGAAAGGVAGAQIGTGVTSAFGGIGGALVGGMVGSAVEKSNGATTAFEYVVRKASGELASVTQQDVKPLEIGQKVLIIAGSQARIVPDYTVTLDPAPPADHTDGKIAAPPPVAAAPLAPPPGAAPPEPTAPPAAPPAPPP